MPIVQKKSSERLLASELDREGVLPWLSGRFTPVDVLEGVCGFCGQWARGGKALGDEFRRFGDDALVLPSRLVGTCSSLAPSQFPWGMAGA